MPPITIPSLVINAQSVGLPFVIGHSDTVEFSSQSHASRREQGSSLNPPPDSPSLSMLCFMSHTGTLVNECLLLSYLRKDVIVTQLSFASSHYSNIYQTRRPWKAFKINICVAFKSQYILYLL